MLKGAKAGFWTGLGHFKVGGSVISAWPKALIVPLEIEGDHHAMLHGTVRMHPGKIRLRFCKPVSTELYKEADALDPADKLQRVVSESGTSL